MGPLLNEDKESGSTISDLTKALISTSMLTASAPMRAITDVTRSVVQTWSLSHSVIQSTSEADRQIGRLMSFKSRTAGWDGHNAEAPNEASLVSAIDLLRKVKYLPVPMPMASVGADGNATLFWNTGKIYADVEVSPDGKIDYLMHVAGFPEQEDEAVLSKDSFPSVVLGALLAAHPAFNR